MKFISQLNSFKKLPIFKDEYFYVYLIIFIVSIFTIVAQIYYVYIHGFNYTRCNFMNNNDKTKCVTKSDMRNFLYHKLFS
jgi:hypothetical protein